jgi:hypothetical protein
LETILHLCRQVLNLYLVGASLSLAAPSGESHFNEDREINYTWPNLPGEVQQEVARYVPNKEFLHLMLGNKELYHTLQQLKYGRVVSYDLHQPQQKEFLLSYLREAKEQGFCVSLKLRNTIEQDIKELTDYLDIVEYLDLTSNQITDISCLKHSHKLRELNLTSTKVKEVSVLSSLSQLHTLNLSWTRIADLNPLGTLPQLYSLILRGTKVQDLKVVSKLLQLELLSLSDTPVENLDALASALKLRMLNLGGTNIKEVRALGNLSQLELLNLGGLEDLAGLGELKIRNPNLKIVYNAC